MIVQWTEFIVLFLERVQKDFQQQKKMSQKFLILRSTSLEWLQIGVSNINSFETSEFMLVAATALHLEIHWVANVHTSDSKMRPKIAASLNWKVS